MWKGESDVVGDDIVQGFSPIPVNNQSEANKHPPNNNINNNINSNNSRNSNKYLLDPSSAKNLNICRHYHKRHFVHWFRKGLRLSDNPSLLRGLRKASSFRCIFILDPWFARKSNIGVNKWRFLLQSLEDLDQSLRKLNSRLIVIRGQPADVLPSLFKEWKTNYFSFEVDPEPYGKIRDDKIIAMCRDLGVHVVKESSHTLYNLNRIIDKNGGKPPLTYRQFVHIISAIGPPKHPVPAINSSMVNSIATPIDRDHDLKFAVPSLRELGFDKNKVKNTTAWPGGESEAIQQLERYLERKAQLSLFGKLRITSQTLISSSTCLSCYLRFGCLSARLLYHSLADLFKKMKNTEPPLALFNQLLWREFFYVAAFQNPNFDRMVGNPICLQIPWDKDAVALRKWSLGKTGFPFIDAIMTQLREEGWIHYICRHVVVCFLTRGDLWLSWEEGMKVFEELLLDSDYSVNAGMWMWLSCSSFFQQFLHVYCPIKFGRKIDPKGDYIKRYVPVLKNYPTEFLHEPWKAPESIQKLAGCVIGEDYPVPMVNHEKISKINEDRLKQVFQQLYSYKMFNLQNAPLEYTPDQEVLKVEQAFVERTKHIQNLLKNEERNKSQIQENMQEETIKKLVLRQQLKRSHKKEALPLKAADDFAPEYPYIIHQENSDPSSYISASGSKDQVLNEMNTDGGLSQCQISDSKVKNSFAESEAATEQELQIFIKALDEFQTTSDILSRPYSHFSSSFSIDFDDEIDKILESIKSEKESNE